ncbi:MAG: translation initiation factor IF-3 [Candidatus Kapabacteria bacterium]|nr:translation initiation factor IF-3 [Candidatus Kapabacteria bacterium]
MKLTPGTDSNHHSSSSHQKDSIASRYKVNSEIQAKEVRLIDENGALIGIVSSREALRISEDRDIDIVEIAPQANPPVCRLIDYGKFIYELQKKDKLQRLHQQQQQMKEIRLKWRIQEHDFNFKLRHARTFIEEGNKVKISLIFRGREITHQDIGKAMIERFVAALEDIAKVDSGLKFEGKSLSVVMTPDKTKKKK